MVGDIFGVVECIVSKIVRAFCKMVRLHLQKKKIKLQKKPDLSFSKKIERLHNIPYIIQAIDNSHILVLAPIFGGEDY